MGTKEQHDRLPQLQALPPDRAGGQPTWKIPPRPTALQHSTPAKSTTTATIGTVQLSWQIIAHRRTSLNTLPTLHDVLHGEVLARSASSRPLLLPEAGLRHPKKQCFKLSCSVRASVAAVNRQPWNSN